jgi:hypothetical protein
VISEIDISDDVEEPEGRIIDNPNAFDIYTGDDVKETATNFHSLATIFGWGPKSVIDNLKQGNNDSHGISASDYGWVKTLYEGTDGFNGNDEAFINFFKGAFCAYVVNNNLTGLDWNNYSVEFYQGYLSYAQQIIATNSIPTQTASDDSPAVQEISEDESEIDLPESDDNKSWDDLSRYSAYVNYEYVVDYTNYGQLGTIYSNTFSQLVKGMLVDKQYGGVSFGDDYEWIRDAYRSKYGEINDNNINTEFNSIIQGLFCEYMYYKIVNENYREYPSGTALIQNFVDYSKTVIVNGYSPEDGDGNQGDGGQGGDQGGDQGDGNQGGDQGGNQPAVNRGTHWPCQLFSYENSNGFYALAFKKKDRNQNDKYHSAGISSMDKNPITTRGVDLYNAMDSKFMDMVEDITNYSNEKFVPDYSY